MGASAKNPRVHVLGAHGIYPRCHGGEAATTARPAPTQSHTGQAPCACGPILGLTLKARDICRHAWGCRCTTALSLAAGAHDQQHGHSRSTLKTRISLRSCASTKALVGLTSDNHPILEFTLATCEVPPPGFTSGDPSPPHTHLPLRTENVGQFRNSGPQHHFVTYSIFRPSFLCRKRGSSKRPLKGSRLVPHLRETRFGPVSTESMLPTQHKERGDSHIGPPE